MSAGDQYAVPPLVKHPFVVVRKLPLLKDMEYSAAALRQACSDVHGTEAAADVIARGRRMADLIVVNLEFSIGNPKVQNAYD